MKLLRVYRIGQAKVKQQVKASFLDLKLVMTGRDRSTWGNFVGGFSKRKCPVGFM